MGVFTCPVRLDSMDGANSLEFEALVDTGASYTMVAASLLERLGVQPVDKITVTLADGSLWECGMGEARATIDGRSTATWVLFGAEDAGALLGAYTLEGLRLAVDPVHLTLVPVTTARA